MEEKDRDNLYSSIEKLFAIKQIITDMCDKTNNKKEWHKIYDEYINITHNASEILKKYNDKPKELSYLEAQGKRIQLQTLVKDIHELNNRYIESQKKSVKNAIKKKTNLADEEIEDLLENFTNGLSAVDAATMAKVDIELEIAKELNRDVIKIGLEINELYEMTKEIELLVNNRQDQIIDISNNIDNTFTNVENGNTAIVASTNFLKKAGKRRICCIAGCAFVVIAGVVCFFVLSKVYRKIF